MGKSYYNIIQNKKYDNEFKENIDYNQQKQNDVELDNEIDRDIRVDFIRRVTNNAKD